MRCWDRCCATTTTGILNDARVTRHTHSHSCMQIKWHAHEWRQDCGRMKWIYADDSDRWGHHMASLASSENQTAFISNGFVSRVFSVLFISPVRKCCDLGIRTAQRHQSVAIKAIRKFSQCNGIWSSLARNFNNSAITTNSFNSFFLFDSNAMTMTTTQSLAHCSHPPNPKWRGANGECTANRAPLQLCSVSSSLLMQNGMFK